MRPIIQIAALQRCVQNPKLLNSMQPFLTALRVSFTVEFPTLLRYVPAADAPLVGQAVPSVQINRHKNI
jgi:hypothetical protein